MNPCFISLAGWITDRPKAAFSTGFTYRLILALSWTLAASWGLAAEKGGGTVKFNQERGFFDKPFSLELKHSEPGVQIYYTLDGTEPKPESNRLYRDPIRVEKNTVIRTAAYQNGKRVGRETSRTFVFPKEIFRQSFDGMPPADWPFRWGGNRVDFGMDPRVVEDPLYAPELERALKSIPSLSLVMDLGDLFDEKRGIYANAMRRGREAERPGSLEWIRPEGGAEFQINAGIRIRGGFSRMPNNAKHSFRFFFRKQYGEGQLKYPLFGEKGAKSFDGFDLRTSQNYSWSMGGDPRAVFIRDVLNRDLQLAMGQPSPRSQFVHLFINGQYWGLYNTCERPEAAFAASYLGGKKDDYDTLKPRGGAGEGGFGPGASGEMPYATDGNKDAWRKLWEAAKAGLSSQEAYFKVLGRNAAGERDPSLPVLLDPENLIDYMLVILYGGNIDAPITKFAGNSMPNNWFAVRSRKGEHGFQSFVWDAEHTLLDLHEDRTGPFPAGNSFEQSNPQWIFQQCLENAEFRMLLADRVEKHTRSGGALSTEGVKTLLDRRSKEIESAVILESARWGDAGGGFGFRGGGEEGNRQPRTRDRDWRKEMERIRNEYIPKRTAILREQLWGLGVLPDVPAPTLAAAGQEVELKGGAGEIVYTLDGKDPRAVGGGRSASARSAQGSIKVSGTAKIKARVWRQDDWGPLASWPVE
ncbi:MAG: hypothetical protein FJ404_09675 [Verrucomicrobia bacterium]|nr:hypothetical protein [Verrucomicrobiota bacterium]